MTAANDNEGIDSITWNSHELHSYIPGTVLAAYISFGVSPAHLVTASVMSAPAALCFSKLFYPETEESKNKAENMIIEKG
jgi:pyrimidine nucleoside transport protein